MPNVTDRTIAYTSSRPMRLQTLVKKPEFMARLYSLLRSQERQVESYFSVVGDSSVRNQLALLPVERGRVTFTGYNFRPVYDEALELGEIKGDLERSVELMYVHNHPHEAQAQKNILWQTFFSPTDINISCQTGAIASLVYQPADSYRLFLLLALAPKLGEIAVPSLGETACRQFWELLQQELAAKYHAGQQSYAPVWVRTAVRALTLAGLNSIAVSYFNNWFKNESDFVEANLRPSRFPVRLIHEGDRFPGFDLGKGRVGQLLEFYRQKFSQPAGALPAGRKGSGDQAPEGTANGSFLLRFGFGNLTETERHSLIQQLVDKGLVQGKWYDLPRPGYYFEGQAALAVMHLRYLSADELSITSGLGWRAIMERISSGQLVPDFKVKADEDRADHYFFINEPVLIS